MECNFLKTNFFFIMKKKMLLIDASMILEADLIYNWNKYYSFLTILMPPFSILNLIYLPFLRLKS